MLALEVKNVNSGYGKSQILHGVTLIVDEGECVAVLGPNGAGKTTLLRTITNIVTPSSGDIVFMGSSIVKVKFYKLARMGICHVLENRHNFPDMSVEENLRLAASNIADKTRESELFSYCMNLFPRLAERMKQRAGTMSGGEQQMLALAKGLMTDPKVLLLDEPSTGLAHILKEQIFEAIKTIAESGKTILMVEQDAVSALDIADRIYVVEQGEIFTEGTPEKLSKDSQLVRAYFGIA